MALDETLRAYPSLRAVTLRPRQFTFQLSLQAGWLVHHVFGFLTNLEN